MKGTVRLLKPHVSSGLEEESSDPASEADKRSDPPAEGESVEVSPDAKLWLGVGSVRSS